MTAGTITIATTSWIFGAARGRPLSRASWRRAARRASAWPCSARESGAPSSSGLQERPHGARDLGADPRDRPAPGRRSGGAFPATGRAEHVAISPPRCRPTARRRGRGPDRAPYPPPRRCSAGPADRAAHASAPDRRSLRRRAIHRPGRTPRRAAREQRRGGVAPRGFATASSTASAAPASAAPARIRAGASGGIASPSPARTISAASPSRARTARSRPGADPRRRPQGGRTTRPRDGRRAGRRCGGPRTPSAAQTTPARPQRHGAVQDAHARTRPMRRMARTPRGVEPRTRSGQRRGRDPWPRVGRACRAPPAR